MIWPNPADFFLPSCFTWGAGSSPKKTFFSTRLEIPGREYRSVIYSESNGTGPYVHFHESNTGERWHYTPRDSLIWGYIVH